MLLAETFFIESFLCHRLLLHSEICEEKIHYQPFQFCQTNKWVHLRPFASYKNLQLSFVFRGVMTGCHNTLEVVP